MRKHILLSILMLSMTTGSAHAGAWLQEKGSGEFIAQASYFTSDAYFNGKGDSVGQPRYNQYAIQPYLEYGLLENLTVGGSAALQRDTQSGAINSGVADPQIFARSVLWRDATQLVSLQPLVKFASDFEHMSAPRGGSKSTDAELSVLYGRNLNLLSPRDYFDSSVGYRYRSGSLDNQIHADAALGLEVAPRWQVIPAIRTVLSTHLQPSTSFSEDGDQDYDLLKLELGAMYHVTDSRAWGLTLFDHVTGRQTGNGEGAMLQLAQKF